MSRGPTLQDWLTYLEGRLDAWAAQMNALIALAGLIPAATVSGGLQLVATPRFIPFVLPIAGGGLLVTFVFLARLVVRRSLLRVTIELILSGQLKTPPDVAEFYGTWMSF
jgi:hypothetical protein